MSAVSPASSGNVTCNEYGSLRDTVKQSMMEGSFFFLSYKGDVTQAQQGDYEKL